MLFRYFLNNFEVLLEWLWDCSIYPSYYWYHFRFYISLGFKIFFGSFLDHNNASWICGVYWQVCSFFINTDYDVLFIVRDGCVKSSPCYFIVWLPHFHNLLLLILVRAYTIFHCPILLLFPCVCERIVEHTLWSCRFLYCSFASVGHGDIMWYIILSYCWRNLHLLPVCYVFSIFGTPAVSYYVIWCSLINWGLFDRASSSWNKLKCQLDATR